jgi:hypothetical protein
MGIQLKERYEAVGKELGPVGRMKLAMLTKMSSVAAANAEDSTSNLRLVDDAILQLRKAM